MVAKKSPLLVLILIGKNYRWFTLQKGYRTAFCPLWLAYESANLKNQTNHLKNSHFGVPFCLASEGAVLETQFPFLKTHISGMPVCSPSESAALVKQLTVRKKT